MNWDVIKGNWKQMQGSVKAKWGDLTDDEITEMSGERDKMVGRIQEKYGMTREKAETEVDTFMRDKG